MPKGNVKLGVQAQLNDYSTCVTGFPAKGTLNQNLFLYASVQIPVTVFYNSYLPYDGQSIYGIVLFKFKAGGAFSSPRLFVD